MLPHAFEKFARGRSSGSGLADGGESTGLGLAIAKGIMQAHGGTIEALSPVAKGRGTCVTLRFPREEAAP
ncbi:MAG: HAMP domain-containing sensor histidine kinase, partial [Hyphomicrobium sp.]|nr:HAMP domain-containing sensor histidine kinase [Hyphomicrobium sp.]